MAIKFSCSVDFTGSTAIFHELAVRGLVVLLCGRSQLTQLALNERGGGGGVDPWVWGLLSPLAE